MNATNNHKDSADLDTILAGYQTAVSLSTAYVQGIWGAFSVVIVANSIVLAVIAGCAAELSHPSLFALVLEWLLPIAGLVLCFSWAALVERNIAFQEYYLFCARELEENHLKPWVKTISNGGRFSSGQEVSLKIEGGLPRLRTRGLERIRGRLAIRIILVVFAAIYLAIFVLTIARGVF
jgi:hypothetical protein